ncbi:Ankyrin repeat-containing domain protein [Russula decolorans]
MLSQPGQGPIYIIVDGVDECPNTSGTPSARRVVLDLIKELAGLKQNVHVCVASQPEIDIRMVLGSLQPLQISLDDEDGHQADIIAFIKYTVHKYSMPGWTEKDQSLVIETLSKKANGMFQLVACQMDAVLRCYSNDIQAALDDVPMDLNKAYERKLRNIDTQKRKYAKRLFQCLFVSIRPLRVEELFAVQFDATSPRSFNEASPPPNAEWAVLSACSCLITTASQGESQVVHFTHSTVKNFLTSEWLKNAEEHLSFYHILPEPAHTTLAHASLSVLVQLDDKIDRDTIGRVPLAPYAARHWVHHALYRNVSTHVKELMERLFDPTDSHFAAWVWLYDIDRYWTEPMSTIHPTPPEAEPLYYASLCGFRGLAEYLITTHSPDMNSLGGSHATPLQAASVKGHLEVASLLLENGAYPDYRGYLGQTPLHLVSQGGQLVVGQSSLEIVRLLIKSGAYVDARDRGGQTPLHTAARHGFWGIAELLLDSGATLDVWNDSRGTPLNVACQMGKLDVSRFLIDRGSNINSRDKFGWTPLHSALGYGHIDVARLLVKCDPDVDARNQHNRTPLLFALRVAGQRCIVHPRMGSLMLQSF